MSCPTGVVFEPGGFGFRSTNRLTDKRELERNKHSVLSRQFSSRVGLDLEVQADWQS